MSTAPLDDDRTPGVVMYTTAWCGYCHRLKRLMTDAGIAFDEIDIEADDDAAQFVMSRNAGDQTVPTLRFDDETTMTNPSIRQVQDKVAALAQAG